MTSTTEIRNAFLTGAINGDEAHHRLTQIGHSEAEAHILLDLWDELEVIKCDFAMGDLDEMDVPAKLQALAYSREEADSILNQWIAEITGGEITLNEDF